MGINLKGILGAVAPTLASMLPGPLGNMAKEAVTSLLGLRPDASEGEIEKTLATANPDILLKLKELDAEFQAKMKQLDIDLEKMSYEDTANARAREIATKDWTPKALAGLVMGGYIALAVFVLKANVPPANHDFVVGAMRIMEMSVVLVLGYYFGSSAGSAKKDDTIHKTFTK